MNLLQNISVASALALAVVGFSLEQCAKAQTAPNVPVALPNSAPMADDASAPSTNRATVTLQPEGEAPLTLSIPDKWADATLTYHAKKVSVSTGVMTLQGNATLEVKKQGKILWSLSVPEGAIIVSKPVQTVTPLSKGKIVQ